MNTDFELRRDNLNGNIEIFSVIERDTNFVKHSRMNQSWFFTVADSDGKTNICYIKNEKKIPEFFIKTSDVVSNCIKYQKTLNTDLEKSDKMADNSKKETEMDSKLAEQNLGNSFFFKYFPRKKQHEFFVFKSYML